MLRFILKEEMLTKFNWLTDLEGLINPLVRAERSVFWRLYVSLQTLLSFLMCLWSCTPCLSVVSPNSVLFYSAVSSDPLHTFQHHYLCAYLLFLISRWQTMQCGRLYSWHRSVPAPRLHILLTSRIRAQEKWGRGGEGLWVGGDGCTCRQSDL